MDAVDVVSGVEEAESSVWLDGPLLAFDVETTGLDVESDRIVSASVVRRTGSDVQIRSWLVNPGVPIPAAATDVHGITDERAAGGTDAPTAIREIVEHLEPGLPLVMFNAPFDLGILSHEAARHGVPFALPERVVDPFVIDRHLDRFRRGSRRLAATCEHYGVPLDNEHDSSSDALAAMRLAWAMCAHGSVVRVARNEREVVELADLEAEWARVRYDADRLHRAQVDWSLCVSEGLRDHFMRTGQTERAESVVDGWPLSQDTC